MFRGAAILVLAAVLGAVSIGGPVAAGEEAADSGPSLEAIRRELAEISHRVAARYLDERPDGRGKADVLLVIGTLYETGAIGGSQGDVMLAFDYYRRAAEMGSPQAHCSVGVMYAKGVEGERGSVPRNPEKAREHLEAAAAEGVTRAMLELGDIYLEGRDVDVDRDKALAFFIDAAKRGEPDALDRLKPVMLAAKEWEAAKPGRKADFPTGVDEIVDKNLTQLNIDINFELQQLYSRVLVELSKRIDAELKKTNYGRQSER